MVRLRARRALLLEEFPAAGADLAHSSVVESTHASGVMERDGGSFRPRRGGVARIVSRPMSKPALLASPIARPFSVAANRADITEWPAMTGQPVTARAVPATGLAGRGCP